MKFNYAKKLNKFNMILGFHVAFKIIIILILFVVLNTSIWIKEKYLLYLKSSIYVQIFVFLTLSIVIIVLNNPHSMGICSNFINYFYLIISILEFGVIFLEVFSMIINLKSFLVSFHECPYIRTYDDIADSDFKRVCLYYNFDNNSELPYKYICYYNSEEEYFNSFCDGLICQKENNKNDINSLVKCFQNIDKNEIRFPLDNEFYLKEFELIYKYKSSNLYACFRKNKVEKEDNIFNQTCPDSNPIKKMLIFIYLLLVLHLLIDFLFIYEFMVIKKMKEIYSNLVLLKNINQGNVLSKEDVMDIQNYFKESNPNKSHKDPSSSSQPDKNKENSSELISAPSGSKSEIKNNSINQDDNLTDVNISTEEKINQYDNILVHQNEDNKYFKKKEKIVATTKNLAKQEKNKDSKEMHRRDSKQKMLNEEVYNGDFEITNGTNFSIKKNTNEIEQNKNQTKDISHKKNDKLLDEIFNGNNKSLNNNYDNIKIAKENNIQINSYDQSNRNNNYSNKMNSNINEITSDNILTKENKTNNINNKIKEGYNNVEQSLNKK